MPDPPPAKYVPALRFHSLTACYDRVVQVTTRERAFKTALVAQTNLRPAQRVLDLACGTGTLTIWLKQACPAADLIGIDGDPEILAMARRKAQNAGLVLQFDQGLSYALPYPDGYFDRVTSSLFFHHLSWRDKQRTALEVFRVMRAGGELHVADWGKSTGLFTRLAFLGVQCLDGFENTRDNVNGRLIEVFREAGFAEVAQRGCFTTPLGNLALYRGVKP